LAKVIIRRAIEAHGRQENLTKTLTGSLSAKASAKLGDMECSITWQETFQLPRRYHRSIKGMSMGKEFSMEYAVTDDKGWIRQDNGPAEEFKLEKKPPNWNSFLATLPDCLKEGVKLSAYQREKVNGQDVLPVEVSGVPGGDVVLYIDSNSGLLVKWRGRMHNPF